MSSFKEFKNSFVNTSSQNTVKDEEDVLKKIRELQEKRQQEKLRKQQEESQKKQEAQRQQQEKAQKQEKLPTASESLDNKIKEALESKNLDSLDLQDEQTAKRLTELIKEKEKENSETLLKQQGLDTFKNVDLSNATEIRSEDLKAQEKAKKRAEEINKAIENKDYLSQFGYALEGAIEGGVSGFAKLGEAGLALGAKSLDKLHDETILTLPLRVIPGVNDKINELTSMGKEKMLENAQYLQDKTSYYQKTIPQINNKALRTAGQVTNTVGEMAPSITANIVAPGSGLLVSGLQVGGASTVESLNADKSNLDKALLTGTLKGTAAAMVEKITGGDFISKGLSDRLAVKGISKITGNKMAQNILWKTYQVFGEAAEENLEDSIDDVIDCLINGKDLPSVQEKLKQIEETTKITGLSTLVLSSLGLGGGNFDTTLQETRVSDLENDINKLSKQTQTEDVQNELKWKQKQLNALLLPTSSFNPTINQETQAEMLPTARQENVLPRANDNLKEQAIEEINNSNVSEEDKQTMLTALNNIENLTNEDMEGIRQTIQTIEENIQESTSDEESTKLDTKINYKNDSERRKKYMQYKNDTSDYDSTIVNEVLDTIPENRNGRRTVKQWLNAAEQIGNRIANLSNEEIEKIAYKSWFDLEPTKSITQYDNVAKTKVGFQKLTSDEWINTINNAVNEARVNNQVQETLPVVNEENKIEENNKQKQLDIIKESNPMTDDYHTGIRNIEDIKTFKEAINDDESFVYGDFSKEDAEKALKEGKVTVYSSHPIEQGSFVSTSQNMAKDYAGNGKVYSQEIDLKDVAWINGDEGQYAKVENNQETFNLQENTPGETINWNEIERPEGKFRKHYQSIIQSSNTTAEAKKIAKEMMGTDTYIPESNKNQIERADKYIEDNGVDKALDRLREHIQNDEVTYDKKGLFKGKNVNVDDIALGERLIQYYSKTGEGAKLQDAIQYTAMMGTEAGRAVQVMSLLNHMTPQGQVVWLQRSVDKMNNELQQKYKNKKNVPQFELTEDMINKVLETDNQEDMYKVLDNVYEELGEQVPKSFKEQIDEWRYFAMLANFKTHARNVIGNVAMGGVQRVKNKVAGAIEGTVAKFNPEMERTHTLKNASKKTKEFAKTDVKNMDVQSGLGMNENKYIPQSRLQSARKTFKSDMLNNTLGKMFDLNSKALEVEDNIGLKSAYINSLSNYITANNIDVDNITDTQLAKARQHAIKEAQEATFHQASALASALNQLSNRNNFTKFALDAVVPFKKTPINIAKTGIQYSPVGLIKTAVFDVKNVRNGNITVNQYIDNISKGLTGTALSFLGYALAEAGILKASGGDDDKKEAYDREQGKQQYALTVGDKTVSLDWLSPVGIPLFVGAEINQQFNESKKEKTSKSTDDDKLLNQIVQKVGDIGTAFSNAAQPMSEMSMISGLTDVLSSYNKENAAGNMFSNATKSYINQFIPTFSSQIARNSDKYERTTKSTKTGVLPKAIDTTVNQIKSKIPGLRQTLPIKTNIWGEDVKQPENFALKTFNNFINPGTVKDISSDKVDKELNSLYEKTNESSIIPQAIDKKFSINEQNYTLTNEEYAKYNKLYGKTAYDSLNNLVNSNNYKNLDNTQKQKAIENIYSYAKEQIKIDYAKQNKLDYKESTLSKTANAVKKANGNVSDYFEYTAKIQDMTTQKEKINVLQNSKYSKNIKSVIYENSIGKDDSKYQLLKNTGIDIDKYLKYKNFTGTKDEKFKYINNINGLSYTQKVLLYGYGENYKLTNTQYKYVKNYINSLNLTSSEKKEILSHFK